MEMKSISGLTFFVKDIDQTVKFYEALGFRFGTPTDGSVTAYVNWFSVKFVPVTSQTDAEFQKEATADPKGSGIYINIKVDDVDEFYAGVVDKGLAPASEPRDWPWGNREFVLRDPDGYKFVFFQKK